jgi:hypothetical protein
VNKIFEAEKEIQVAISFKMSVTVRRMTVSGNRLISLKPFVPSD